MMRFRSISILGIAVFEAARAHLKSLDGSRFSERLLKNELKTEEDLTLVFVFHINVYPARMNTNMYTHTNTDIEHTHAHP